MTDISNPTAITWLESSLPETTAAFDSDAEDLQTIREEVRLLKEELAKETGRNTDLQSQIIASRAKNDEMVAMMQLLRSETEAVLERYVIFILCNAHSTLPLHVNAYSNNIVHAFYTQAQYDSRNT